MPMRSEVAVPIEQAEVICATVEASCRCVLPPHGAGPHRCACGGSWEITEDGQFVGHALPGSGEEWDGPGPDDYLPDFAWLFSSL